MSDKKRTAERLLAEFPPVSREAWEAVITADLKGADYEKRLVWKPLEGFSVAPYYRAEDLEGVANVDVQPGDYPYVRGTSKGTNPWLVRQEFCASDPARANSEARDAIERGATSVGFHLGKEVDAQLIRQLLEGIDPTKVELVFTPHGRADAVFCALGEVLPKEASGAIEFAPLVRLTKKGALCSCHGGAKEHAVASVEFIKAHPHFRVLVADGRPFHNAGATAVQELAYTLAQVSEYMKWLTEGGIAAPEAAKAIRINLSVGATYFMEMAKFRAARYLWSRLLEAFGIGEKEAVMPVVHAETSRFNQTVYDPYVNLLRATTESMSAILAGVHSLTVMPFDAPYSAPSPLSSRLARNAQLVLREESYFDKVVDPAGGSYYIETLTASLIKASWELFLQVEADGGFVEAFMAGKIQAEVERIATERRKRIATRRDTILGTNQFPNFSEHLSGQSKEEGKCGCCCKGKGEDYNCESEPSTKAEPLHPFRGAEAFEELRGRVDALPECPKAFMLTVGNLAMRRARAQFSCNFLACAGFDVIDNIGFESVAAGMAEARKAGARIIVLCSSDDEYAAFGPEAFKAIKDELFIVAGAPTCQAELEALGVKHFISVRSNLLQTLEGFQRELGIVK